MDINIFKMINM